MGTILESALDCGVRGLKLKTANEYRWRDGRVAEGGGLLNRYTVKSRIGGSNPPLSASPFAPFCIPLLAFSIKHPAFPLTRPTDDARLRLHLLGAYWFRPGRYAGGGMPRTVRWPR